ncbi:ROK family protein [Psychromonas sp. KJ10-10]|uniref:ROK family protein n=1 Tax=Psychromonas sp. KJ10-10 TaxID=3391823 RepID=UPI0039B5702E
MQDATNYLGKTIAMLINVLNPEKIIIAGKIAQCGNTLFAIIQQSVTHQTLPKFQKKITIVPGELQQDSTIAAFSLIKEAIYEGDLLQKIRI